MQNKVCGGILQNALTALAATTKKMSQIRTILTPSKTQLSSPQVEVIGATRGSNRIAACQKDTIFLGIFGAQPPPQK